LVTGFDRDGAHVTITNFGDAVTIGGHRYVAIYSRVTVADPTSGPVTLSPQASPGLIPLNSAPDEVAPHSGVSHDYVVASDRFGGSYPWPSRLALARAGGYDRHFAHMRAYWNGQLSHLALPDPSLAGQAGFIYTQIIRSGGHPKSGPAATRAPDGRQSNGTGQGHGKGQRGRDPPTTGRSKVKKAKKS
jgi:hypothetical protein